MKLRIMKYLNIIIFLLNNCFPTFTQLLEDPCNNSNNYYTIAIIKLNNKALFIVDSPGNYTMFSTEGTKNTTTYISKIRGFDFNYLSTLDGHFYFSNNSKNSSNIALWRTDGSIEGTEQLFEFNSNTFRGPNNITFVNNLLYFSTASDEGYQFWKYSLSNQSIQLVKNFAFRINSDGVKNLINVNGQLFFTIKTNEYGIELWTSDGTELGTKLVKDINQGPLDSKFGFFQNVNNNLIFSVDDGVHGMELWKSNGTEIGTNLIKDINIGTNGSLFRDYQQTEILDNVLYFNANDGIGDFLCRSDGTEVGTYIVTKKFGYPTNLKNIGGNLYFSGGTNANGFELWKSDGTNDGTILFKDLVPGFQSSKPQSFLEVSNGFYFIVHKDPENEIWFSDGTPSNTYISTKVKYNFNAITPNIFTHVNGYLFFVGKSTSNNFALFRNDGSLNGTFPVNSIIQSIKTGSWDDLSIWPCNEIPQPYHNVEILKNHVISINGLKTINSIKLEGQINFEENSNLQFIKN